MPTTVPCLWFDMQAEDAAKLYTSLFKNSKILQVTHYGPAGPGPSGSVMTVRFVLDGQEFLGLNGGPIVRFNEAVSFVVKCETQKDLDRYWEQLTAGGSEVQCGWLKDRFGVSWQIVPTVLDKLMDDKNPAGRDRVMAALLMMKKLDIAALERAHAGDVRNEAKKPAPKKKR
jgi:predicted 3-demethylubiquinone-9 3-methyltransferase (glyoxalase superfamily)